MQEDRELLRKIAKMLLVDGKDKQEVEQMLIDTGIVKVKRRGPGEPKKKSSKHLPPFMKKAGELLLDGEAQNFAAQTDSINRVLSDKVRKHCGLLDVIIPTHPPHTDATPLEETAHLCRFSAEYVSRQIQIAEKNETWVMMGGGNENFYTARFLDERRRPFTRFAAYAVIGRGFDPRSVHIGPESCLTYAWIRSGMLPGHLYYATATPPKSYDTKGVDPADIHSRACIRVRAHTDALLKESPQIETVHKLAHANILIAGFGLATNKESHNPLTMAGVLREYGIDMTRLRSKAGAAPAGDFAYAIFDDQGNGHDEWEFLLTAGYPNSVKYLKKRAAEPANKVIGVGGYDRLPAIKAALKGKLFNVLITDRRTGDALFADSTLKV
jgi:Putative sugar-binding domain